jgi:hypothetical protein
LGIVHCNCILILWFVRVAIFFLGAASRRVGFLHLCSSVLRLFFP